MKFDVGAREAEFGFYNNRAENHGKEKVKAMDLPFTIPITMREMDIILPLQEGKISEVLYDKKKNLQTHYLEVLHVSRKPENITVQIHHIEARHNAKPMEFVDCKIKDPAIHLNDKGATLTGKIQISDIDSDSVKEITDNVEGKKRKLKFWANAPTLDLESQPKKDDEADGENDQDDDE